MAYLMIDQLCIRIVIKKLNIKIFYENSCDKKRLF